MEVLASALRGRELYRLLTSIIVPRPIAWVGTRSVQGVDNLAPFSFFMGVSSKPPAVAISVARAGRDRLKHTAQNILDTGVFTVSIPSTYHLEQVAGTAAQYPESVSELEQWNLVARPGTQVDAPFPAQAGVALECRCIHTHDLGTTHLIVGEVLVFHIHDELVLQEEGRLLVDSRKLDPLARLGGIDYAGLGHPLQAVVPRVED